MVCRLIDFVFVVLKIMLFKVCGIIGISKITFFNFSGIERVKEDQKKVKNHSKPPKLVSQSLFVLSTNSNISKTVRVNIAFKKRFFKEYLIWFMTVYRLIDFAFVVLKLLLFKVCGIIGISKNEIFNFSGPERVKQSNQGNIYMFKVKTKNTRKKCCRFWNHFDVFITKARL